MVELKISIERELGVLEQVMDAIFQVHHYEQPVIFLREDWASRVNNDPNSAANSISGEADGSPRVSYAAAESSNPGGQDTFSDFVTLVCQEAQTSQASHVSSNNNSTRQAGNKVSAYFSTSMYPPPPPGPSARPVGVLRASQGRIGIQKGLYRNLNLLPFRRE